MKIGADDEVRTRDIQIGNLTLYQLSYIRVAIGYQTTPPPATGPQLSESGHS
jgi:hypothetical protein